MSDRTTAYLYVTGVITDKDVYDTFLNFLKYWGAEELFDSYALTQEGIISQSIIFEDVNYGEIPPDLKTFLIDQKLSFLWSWDAGGCYGAGASIYDASDDYQKTANTVEGDYFVTLDRIENLEYIAELREMKARDEKISRDELFLLKSSHSVLLHTKKTAQKQSSLQKETLPCT